VTKAGTWRATLSTNIAVSVAMRQSRYLFTRTIDQSNAAPRMTMEIRSRRVNPVMAMPLGEL
jgi:hypothetical protein